MKKVLVIVLSVAMIFALSACGKNAEETDAAKDQTYTTIPFGGNLGDVPMDKPACGDAYVKVDLKDLGFDTMDGVQTDAYYCEGSDTPWIVVYRWDNKDNIAVEEETKAESEKYGDGYYQMFEYEGAEHGIYYYDFTDKNDIYYYGTSIIRTDDKDFVEVTYLSATEELQLGESDQYIWIPTGYTNIFDEKVEPIEGVILGAEYDDSYCMPYIYVGKDMDSYENEEWNWERIYPDGLPFDEATYQKWEAANWDEASSKAYYESLGFEIVNSFEQESNGCDVWTYVLNDGSADSVDIYVSVDEEVYNIYLASEDDPFPAFGVALVHSLHNK